MQQWQWVETDVFQPWTLFIFPFQPHETILSLLAPSQEQFVDFKGGNQYLYLVQDLSVQCKLYTLHCQCFSVGFLSRHFIRCESQCGIFIATNNPGTLEWPLGHGHRGEV